MVAPITSFEFVSQSVDKVSGEVNVTFQFDTPTDNKVTAFKLYRSYDDPNQPQYVELWIYEEYTTDTVYVVRSNSETGKSIFIYTLNSSDIGRKLYFTIVAVNTKWEESVPSDYCLVYGLPEPVKSIVVSFDNFNTIVNWSPISLPTSPGTGVNSTFASYGVYRYQATPVAISSVRVYQEENAILSDYFKADCYIWIIDNVKKSMWMIYNTTEGIIRLENDYRMLEVFDTTLEYRPLLDNLSIYVQDIATRELVGYTTETTYQDASISKNTVYFYEVVSRDISNQESQGKVYPIDTLSLQQRIPVLRPLSHSENPLLYQAYWRLLKTCLIDSNYYNKAQFAIPYLKGGYIFHGYLGVSNALVDIFMNGTYWKTVNTNEVGAFQFVCVLSKTTTTFQIQGRDYKNIEFSVKSTVIPVTPINIYTFFSVLGQEYDEVWVEATNQHDDFSFTDGRTEALENKFSAWLNITRDVSEDADSFTQQMKSVFLAYEYAGVPQGLYQVLDAFASYCANFDHYELYLDNALWHTKQTGRDFVVLTSTGFTGINRANYVYGVTCISDEGEETDPTLVRIDSRWWPVLTTESCHLYNVFRWTSSSTVKTYGIYRYEGPIDEFEYSRLYFLCTGQSNIFVDAGYISPNTTKTPLPRNITPLFPPTEVEQIIRTRVVDRSYALRQKHWIEVILFAQGETDIPVFQLERLKNILLDLIPPEIGLVMRYCNDTTSTILT